MKVTVKIDERYFEVEIENLHTRPIVATVEGERFEVWPEGGFVKQSQDALSPGVTQAAPSAQAPVHTGADVPAGPVSARDAKAVYAPIPGVIVSIDVEAGQTVEVGQQLCVLEAMKMKNAIRAPRAGVIADVFVTPGEHVKHHDVLVEYGE